MWEEVRRTERKETHTEVVEVGDVCSEEILFKKVEAKILFNGKKVKKKAAESILCLSELAGFHPTILFLSFNWLNRMIET